jgi:hypothetical protein
MDKLQVLVNGKIKYEGHELHMALETMYVHSTENVELVQNNVKLLRNHGGWYSFQLDEEFAHAINMRG